MEFMDNHGALNPRMIIGSFLNRRLFELFRLSGVFGLSVLSRFSGLFSPFGLFRFLLFKTMDVLTEKLSQNASKNWQKMSQ